MRYDILSIDETGLTKLELSGILSKYDIYITGAMHREEAIDLVANNSKNFKALIWSLNSVEADDFLEIKRIKSTPDFKGMPLIIVSRHTDKKYIIKAIEAGAVEFIARPYDTETVESKICKVLGITAGSKAIAVNDDIITYSFKDMLNKEIKSASRGNYSLTIMLVSAVSMDSDFTQSKRQEVIDTLLRILKTKLRETDSIFHYDDSRLILLLPFSNKSGAKTVEGKVNGIFNSHSLLKDKINGCTPATVYVSFPEDGKIKDKLLEKLGNQYTAYIKECSKKMGQPSV